MTQNSGANFFQQVCEISAQLAHASVAGFWCYLDQDLSFSINHVSCDQVAVLLDEYNLDFGARRDSLVDQISLETSVDIKDLYWGEPGLLFGIFGEAGTGKTALMLHLQWRINCGQPSLLQDLLDNDVTWAYFNDIKKFKYFKTELPPLNAIKSGSYLGLNLSKRNVPEHPVRLIALYVHAHDLVMSFSQVFGISALDWSLNAEYSSNDSRSHFEAHTNNFKTLLDLETLFEAAYKTYHRVVGKAAISHDEFVIAYRSSSSVVGTVCVHLFVDGIEYVNFKSRCTLLNLLAQSATAPDTNIYRIFFTSRPLALCNFLDIPDSIIWLYLKKLTQIDEKRRLLSSIAPQLIQNHLISSFIEYCETPFLISLLANLCLNPSFYSHTTSLYGLFDAIVNLVHDNVMKVSDGYLDIFPEFQSDGIKDIFKNFNCHQIRELVDLVAFFCHCWVPSLGKCDWAVCKRFKHLIFILLKHAHQPLESTILGKLRLVFIGQSQSTLSESENSVLNDEALTRLASFLWRFATVQLKCMSFVHWMRSSSTHGQQFYEIIFRDEQILQYFATSFLTNQPFEASIFESISRVRENMVDFDRDFPDIFSWTNERYMTCSHWSFVYDLAASKMGISWLAQRVLSPNTLLHQWLDSIIQNQGIDKHDWGQIRFSCLIRALAIVYEDFSFQKKLSEKNDLKRIGEHFELTLLSIVEHNPSGIFHIKPYPVSKLNFFSDTAMQVLLIQIVDVACKGNSLFVIDIFLDLASRRKIGSNVISHVTALFDKCISPPIAHRLLAAVCSCTDRFSMITKGLSADVPEAQFAATKVLLELGVSAYAEACATRNINSLLLADKNFESFLIDTTPTSQPPGPAAIFDEYAWDLLVRKSVSRIQELVMARTQNFLAATLLSQIFAMMQSEDCNCRALPFLLTGGYDKSIISKLCQLQIDESLLIQDDIKSLNGEEAIKPLMNNWWRPRNSILEFSLFESLCTLRQKDDTIDKLLLPLAEIFGPKAVTYIQNTQFQILMHNIPMLNALSRWCLQQLSECGESSSSFFSIFAVKELRQIFLNLLLSDRSLLVHFNHEMLNRMLKMFDKASSGLLSPEPKQLRLTAIHVLNGSALASQSGDYRLHAVDKIVWLLGVFGLSDPIFSLPLLETLYSLLSDSKFFGEKEKIIALLSRNNLYQKLTQTLQKPQGTVPLAIQNCAASLLCYFVATDSEDMFEYIPLLSSPSADIYSLGIACLASVDYSLVSTLLLHLAELPFSSNFSLYAAYTSILIALGRRGGRFTARIKHEALEHLSRDSDRLSRQSLIILADLGFDAECRTCLELWFADRVASPSKLTQNDSVLLSTFIDFLPSFDPPIAGAAESLLILLRDAPHAGLAFTICKSFKKLSSTLDTTERNKCEDLARALLQHREDAIREIAVKVISYLGRDVISRSAAALVKLSAADLQEPYVRKRALAALSHLLKTGDDQLRKETLLLLPAVSSSLGDRFPVVLIQALNIIASLKGSKCKRVNLEKIPSIFDTAEPVVQIDGNGMPYVVQSQTLLELPAAAFDDESWYIRKVVKPNMEQLSSILTKKKTRYNIRVKIALLNCLGQAPHYLLPHLDAFRNVVTSDNGSNLVDFGESIKSLCPVSLLYIPHLIAMNPAPVLARNLLKLLTRHGRLLTPKVCKLHFPLHILVELLNNKDVLVRKVGVSLLGKYVLESPKLFWLLILKWSDSNNKVRKEVMEVLGDIGRKKPEYISQILSLIDPKSVTSIMVWTFLSKSWGVFISNSLIKKLKQSPPQNNSESKK